MLSSEVQSGASRTIMRFFLRQNEKQKLPKTMIFSIEIASRVDVKTYFSEKKQNHLVNFTKTNSVHNVSSNHTTYCLESSSNVCKI